MTDPQQLVDALVEAGWTIAGTGLNNSYQRLAWPSPRPAPGLLIPLDTTAPDYHDLLGAALAQLRDAERLGAVARHVLRAVEDTRGPGRLSTV